MINPISLDTLCAALTAAMGVEAPKEAAAPVSALVDYVAETFQNEKADRIFMYNPDAIAQWVYEKYPQLFTEAKSRLGLELPFCTVMPSVTPVCFGTMYTGAQPAVHGIQGYVKPVITIDTFFDAMIRAGKKVALVAHTGSSMAKIFLEREMDYYTYDSIDQLSAKAAELILLDEHDVICVYHDTYDTIMHKYGPESVEALAELRANVEFYGMFCSMIEEKWKKHNTLVGFAMDHGCHEIDGGCGSHGLDMPEDLNIVHLYKAYPAEK